MKKVALLYGFCLLGLLASCKNSRVTSQQSGENHPENMPLYLITLGYFQDTPAGEATRSGNASLPAHEKQPEWKHVSNTIIQILNSYPSSH